MLVPVSCVIVQIYPVWISIPFMLSVVLITASFVEVELNIATSVNPGDILSVRFSASDQLFVMPPPSHTMKSLAAYVLFMPNS